MTLIVNFENEAKAIAGFDSARRIYESRFAPVSPPSTCVDLVCAGVHIERMWLTEVKSGKVYTKSLKSRDAS